MARLAEVLAPARRVLVLAHRDPDGDAIGSVLGLMHLLKSAGKQVFAHRAGQVAEEYAFLPGLELVREDLPQAEDVDLAVLLDCHEPERAQPRWVDPGMAATSQMVVLLAQSMGLLLGKPAATCLFVGLQTDTGRFSYSNTTPSALCVAADLVAAGADTWAITQEVYSTSLARLRLFARVTDGLELLAGGRLALAQAKASDLVELGCPPSDLDRIVEEYRAIRGVEVAALLKEIDQHSVKASLRSRGRVDVGALAIGLGGGGHHNAAGAKLEGSLDGAAARLGVLLEERLATALKGQG
ncbi:MAG: DHH family phosphoesterase [Desulfarculus sp.]|nr:DHH family phosphoesterase [Desulfarculus sp.]